MITRIVQLHFQKDKVQEFFDFFDTVKHEVNNFPGCDGMRLMQDVKHPEIIITYSKWESEEALNIYRDSETFGKVWPTIKPWFEERPHAWTIKTYFDGFSFK